MLEELLIFMLIYLGAFFILPDNIRRKSIGIAAVIGLVGLYVIYQMKRRDGFAIGQGCGESGKACPTSCQFTADLSSTGALTNISIKSGELLQGMKITNNATTLPINITLTSYSGTTGQLSAGTYNAGPDGFKGSILAYCMINQKDLPKSDVDQTVIFNIYGRYVRVLGPASSGDGYFGLSQVIVNDATGANIALNRPTTENSRFTGGGGGPSIVVDGTATPRGLPNIWHSSAEGGRNSYWQVDLGSVQMVTTVRVIARADYGEKVGIAAGQVNRTTGIRVVVMQTPSDTPAPKGVCMVEPTPVYPAGATVAEQAFLKDLILDGLNGQAALNIYRALQNSTPSSLTPYGLTDSQSATAYVQLFINNAQRQRRTGAFNDTQYYDALNTVKGVTTMAALPFNAADSLKSYMDNNRKSSKTANLNPDGSIIKDAAGNFTFTVVSDNGSSAAVNQIITSMRPSATDTSAGYSTQAKASSDGLVAGAPDTKDWSMKALASVPQQRNTINLTTVTPTIVNPDTTPEQIAAATPAQVPFAAQSIDSGAMTAAASSGQSRAGYSKPDVSAGAGAGRLHNATTEVYYIGGGSQMSFSDAQTLCTKAGGDLATRDQLNSAHGAGAQWCVWGWLKDGSVGYPMQSSECQGPGVKQTTGYTPNGANCFGVKPSQTSPGFTVPDTNIGGNAVPFSTYSTPAGWSQATYVNTNACPSGTVSKTCARDGGSITSCLPSGQSCERSCPSGTSSNNDSGQCK